MPAQSPLALFLEPLERLGLPYCVTGSIAASVYGEPRLTADIDVVLLLLKAADLDALRGAFPGIRLLRATDGDVTTAGIEWLAGIVQSDLPHQPVQGRSLAGIGWSTPSTTAISATVAPWFERHQGRSIALAIALAVTGAIAGVLLPLIGRVLRFRGPAELVLARMSAPVLIGASLA